MSDVLSRVAALDQIDHDSVENRLVPIEPCSLNLLFGKGAEFLCTIVDTDVPTRVSAQSIERCGVGFVFAKVAVHKGHRLNAYLCELSLLHLFLVDLSPANAYVLSAEPDSLLEARWIRYSDEHGADLPQPPQDSAHD